MPPSTPRGRSSNPGGDSTSAARIADSTSIGDIATGIIYMGQLYRIEMCFCGSTQQLERFMLYQDPRNREVGPPLI